MSLPEKAYFYLPQLAGRWQTSMTDLRDYAEQGQLEIQIWLDEAILKVYRLKKTEDGETAPVPTGVTSHRGYVIVEPFELRKIFRDQKAAVKKFTSLDRKDLFKLHQQSEARCVAVEDLMVSRCERDRFEVANGIKVASACIIANTKTGIMPVSSGRPSVMGRITERYVVRKKAGDAMPTLMAEAKCLRLWAQEEMPGVQIPAVKTIHNRLIAIAAE